MDTKECLSLLEKQIAEKHLLKNRFYIAWTEGRLSKECLKEYAKDYYHHVRAFPTYLSALHSHTEDMSVRKEILNNLIEEEAGEPNHPDLWKRFALSLGVTEEEIVEHKPSCEMGSLIDTFRSLCQKGSLSEGLAALYAYESQIPAICESKIEGLKSHYSMTNPSSYHYFTVHIAADVEHSRVERELLVKHTSEQTTDSVLQAAEKVLNTLWNYLESLYTKYHSEHCCLS